VAKPTVLKPREVVALLGKLGFAEVRQRGSHRQFRHADGRGTTVPFHQGRDISPTLLRQIAKDIGLAVEDLLSGRPGQPSSDELRRASDAPPSTKKSSEPDGS
jgi:predicted RNA binding protein YcfA (HicA-like mRNA interferase family)